MRPAPTIEGTATEVSVASPGEESSEAGDAADQDDEPAKQESEDHPEDGAVEVEADPTEIEPEAAAAEPELAEAAPESGARKVSPPPAATISEMKGFVTHLAAGLLGGLIGVIALAFAWHLLPGGQSGKASSGLATLESRLAKLEAVPPSAPDTAAVSKLAERITALEGRAPETPPDLSELTGRVAQMESALKALAEAAKDGGSVTDAAAVSQQVGEAEQRLQAKLDKALADAEAANASALQAMQAAIDGLEAKIGALAEAGLGDDQSPDVAALSDRIAKLEAALPGLEGAIDKSVAGTKSAAAALAFANLRAAVADGRPYAAELATIKSFVPEPGDLGPLSAYAEKGIPTVPALARSFAASEDAARAAAVPPGSGSILDRLLASAATIVKIKRVDEAATGDGPSAVLARARALMDKGDLAGSAQQIAMLQGAPRDAFAAWLADANVRLGAENVVTRLEATLLASVGGAPNKAQN